MHEIHWIDLVRLYNLSLSLRTPSQTSSTFRWIGARLPTRPAMSRSSSIAFCYSAAGHGQTAMEMQHRHVSKRWRMKDEVFEALSEWIATWHIPFFKLKPIFEKGYEMLGTCFVVGLLCNTWFSNIDERICEATKRNLDACIVNHHRQTDVKYILNRFEYYILTISCSF